MLEKKRTIGLALTKAISSIVMLLLFVFGSGTLHAQKFLGNVLDGFVPITPAFTQYWNQVTPGNAGKWGSTEPSRDNYNWSGMDQTYNFANQNGFLFKGHTLIWGSQQPNWIGSLSQTEQRAEIEEWIRDYFIRYPGTDMIDVVNEPLHAPPTQYLNALGGSGATGWDWVITAFQLARQYAPSGCKLILNDYGIISSTTAANDLMNIVNILNSRGLIDGIGIQCHAFNMDNVSTSTMTQVLGILDNAGLPIYVSELDMRGNDQQQLQRYQEKFPIFWNDPDIAGITIWGYYEGFVWLEGSHLLNSNGTERPALTWLMNFVGGSNPGGGDQVWLEAECGSVGSLWSASSSGSASNGQYVTIQPGNNSTGSAPGNANGHINYNFNISSGGNYTLWARVIAPNGNDDSFWVRMDGGIWNNWNNIAPGSTSWTWDDVTTYNLSSGNHTLTIAYREDGAQLDKLYLASSGAPAGTGSAASNCGGNNPSTYYQLQNRATGLFLDGMGRTVNGDPCGQYASTTHVNAQWELIDVGAGYRQLRNRGTGLLLDGMGRTTNGSDCGQYANTTHVNSHWSVQQFDGNYYRLQNRGTGLYLDGMGRTTNGAACGQWANTTHPNAQWQLINVSATLARAALPETSQQMKRTATPTVFYPNPVHETLNIQREKEDESAVARIFTISGQLILNEHLPDIDNTINVTDLAQGVYLLEVITPSCVKRSKLIKK